MVLRHDARLPQALGAYGLGVAVDAQPYGPRVGVLASLGLRRDPGLEDRERRRYRRNCCDIGGQQISSP